MSAHARAILAKARRTAWFDATVLLAAPLLGIIVGWRRDWFWFGLSIPLLLGIAWVTGRELRALHAERATCEVRATLRKLPARWNYHAWLPHLLDEQLIVLDAVRKPLKVPARAHEELSAPGPHRFEFWPRSGLVVAIDGAPLES